MDKTPQSHMKCPLCEFDVRNYLNLNDHLLSVHKIDIVVDHYEFDKEEVTVKEFAPKQVLPLYKLHISEVLQKPDFLKDVENFSVQICGEITCIHRISNKHFAITVKDHTGEILAKKFDKEDKHVLLEYLHSTKAEPNKTMQSYLFEDFVFEASRLNSTSIKENESADRESTKLINEIIDWLAAENAPDVELKESGKIIINGVLQDQNMEEYVNIFDYRLLNNDLEFQDIINEFKYLHEMKYK